MILPYEIAVSSTLMSVCVVRTRVRTYVLNDENLSLSTYTCTYDTHTHQCTTQLMLLCHNFQLSVCVCTIWDVPYGTYVRTHVYVLNILNNVIMSQLSTECVCMYHLGRTYVRVRTYYIE